MYVWGILAGSAVGLLASTLGRLYSSTYYALRDTRTPLRYAVVRVGVGTVLGYLFAVRAPAALGIPRIWGAAGLTLSAGIAGWIEMLLLRRALNARIGRTGLPAPYVATLWLLAMASAAALGRAQRPAAAASGDRRCGVLGPYGALFVGGALLRGIPRRGRWCGDSGHGVDRRSRSTRRHRARRRHGEDTSMRPPATRRE